MSIFSQLDPGQLAGMAASQNCSHFEVRCDGCVIYPRWLIPLRVVRWEQKAFFREAVTEPDPEAIAEYFQRWANQFPTAQSCSFSNGAANWEQTKKVVQEGT